MARAKTKTETIGHTLTVKDGLDTHFTIIYTSPLTRELQLARVHGAKNRTAAVAAVHQALGSVVMRDAFIYDQDLGKPNRILHFSLTDGE